MKIDFTTKFLEHFSLNPYQNLDELTEREVLCGHALGDFPLEGLTFPQPGGLAQLIRQRFTANPALVPMNCHECVAAAKYWSDLMALRDSRNKANGWQLVGLAHQQFCLELLAEADIEDADEAITIIEILETDAKLMAHPDMGSVMKNLVVRPRAHER